MSDIRLPPHDEYAERALLGSMILAGGDNIHAIGDAMMRLRGPEDFFKPAHTAIYQAIVSCYDSDNALDMVLLRKEIDKHVGLKSVGGLDYLIELAENAPVSTNAPYYAKIVAEKSALRRMENAASNVIEAIHRNGQSPIEIFDAAERELYESCRNVIDTSKTVSAAELVQQTMEYLHDKDHTAGLETGIGALDDLLTGLHNGEMVVLAARPSQGKTAIGLDMARHISWNLRKPCLFMSLEMSRLDIGNRLLAAAADVSLYRMRGKTVDRAEVDRLTIASHNFASCPLLVDDSAYMTAMKFRVSVRRMHAKHSLACVVIDYLQRMHSPGCENRQVEISQISGVIKETARELNIPIITLAQLNRMVEGRGNKIPMLSDLRESGSIEQDADIVIMLNREDCYHRGEEGYVPTNKAQLIVAKNRNGPCGAVELDFNPQTANFKPSNERISNTWMENDNDNRTNRT